MVCWLSNIVVGVWFGNDNDSPMKNIAETAPAILWREFMVSAHENISPKDLNIHLQKKEHQIKRLSIVL